MTQIRTHEVRGTSRRGQRRSQKPSRALRSRGIERGSATTSRSARIEPRRVLGTSCRASRRGPKGAGIPSLQSVGVLRGTGAAWKECPLGRVRREISGPAGAQDGGTHLGLRRNASPFAGRCGSRRPGDGTRHVHVGRAVRCGHNAREVPPPVAAPARRKRCAVPGSRRGFARRNDGANLHSSGSGPREARLFGGEILARLVSPRLPQGRLQGEGTRRATSPSFAERGHSASSR
jgi:hypothetical protein